MKVPGILFSVNASCEGRALRDAHLSDDKAVAKMGHPALEVSQALSVEKQIPACAGMTKSKMSGGSFLRFAAE
jgi:hypothetical protein